MQNTSRLISFEQLRYFLALTQELHFTRAAEKCNIAQPPFSRSISKLEDSLKTPLIIRKNRAIELTPAGIVFAEYASQILTLLDESISAVQATQPAAQSLRLGMLEYAFTVFEEQFIEDFSTQHPHIHLELVDSPPEHLAFAVTHGAIDLQFAALTDRDRLPVRSGLRESIMITEPIAALLHETHPLAKAKMLSIRDLAQQRLVLFERNRAPDVYRTVMQAFADHGMQTKIELEVGFFQTMIAAVRKTNRIGLVPFSANSLIPTEMKVIPIATTDIPNIRLSLVWSESKESPELLAFVQWVFQHRPDAIRRHQLHNTSR